MCVELLEKCDRKFINLIYKLKDRFVISIIIILFRVFSLMKFNEANIIY